MKDTAAAAEPEPMPEPVPDPVPVPEPEPEPAAETDNTGTPYDPAIHRAPPSIIKNGRNKGRWRLIGNTRYPKHPAAAEGPTAPAAPAPDFPEVSATPPTGSLPRLDLAGLPHSDPDNLDGSSIPDGQIRYSDAEMLQATADTHLMETLTIAAFAEGYSTKERDQIYAANCAMRHHYNLPKEPVWLVCCSTWFAVTTGKYQKPKCKRHFQEKIAAIIGRVRAWISRRKEAAKAVEPVTGPPIEPVEEIYNPPPPGHPPT